MNERLMRRAAIKKRSPHWLMREALREYTEKEELVERLRHDTLERWEALRGSKVSFLYYPYPLIKNMVDTGNIKVASIEDIACMKVIAIAQRSEEGFF